MNNYPPYIYEPSKSIEVLGKSEKYLDDNPQLKEKIINLGWCYQSIGKSIQHTTENFKLSCEYNKERVLNPKKSDDKCRNKTVVGLKEESR